MNQVAEIRAMRHQALKEGISLAVSLALDSQSSPSVPRPNDG